MKKWYKECPFCANEIKKKAIKCQFCGEWLSDNEKIVEEEKHIWKIKTEKTNNKKSTQKSNDTKASTISFEKSTKWTYILRILHFIRYIFVILFFVQEWISKIWNAEDWWIPIAAVLIIYEIVSLLKDIKKIRNNQYIVKWIERKTYIKSIIISAIFIRFVYSISIIIGLSTIDIGMPHEYVYRNRIPNIILMIVAIWIFDLIINCINWKKVNLWRAILPSYLSIAVILDTIWKSISTYYYWFTVYPLGILLILGFVPAILTKIFRYFYDKKNNWNTDSKKKSKKCDLKRLFANITMEKIIAKKKIIFIVLWVLFLLIISTVIISKHHKKKTAENNCITNYWNHSILVKDWNNWYKCNCESWYDREWLKNKSKCISKKEISDRECKNAYWNNAHWNWIKAPDWWYYCDCNVWYFFDDEDNPSKCTNDKELWEIYCKDFKNTYSDWSKAEDWEYNCRCKQWYHASIRWWECISSHEGNKWTTECKKVFWENSYSDWSKNEEWEYLCRCEEGYDRNKSNTKCIKK